MIRTAVLEAAKRELLWQNQAGRWFIGSGTSAIRAPDVTDEAGAALADGQIERRFATSAVFRLTDAGRAALNDEQPTERYGETRSAPFRVPPGRRRNAADPSV